MYDYTIERWRYGIERISTVETDGDDLQPIAWSFDDNVIGNLSVGPSHVYWLEYSSGVISSRRRDLSARETPVVEGLTDVLYYAVGDDQLVWSDPQAGAVRTVSLPAGSARTLTERLDNPRQLAVFAEEVFVLDWVESNAEAVLLRIDGDGTASPLATSAGTGTVMVDDGEVFWMSVDTATGAGSIEAISIGGGTRRRLKSFDATGTEDFTVDSESVYWSTAADGGMITKLSRDGGSEDVLVAANTVEEVENARNNQFHFVSKPTPSGIAIDEEYVYWFGKGTRNLLRVAK